ncbi:protein of unknown function [Candidatus Nitrosocaldus cavascurensis]|uniref:Uncharacterized protein n=1 Tax=Candidatus Nitrosocaldus cavascurensis TaxID=2058097 RepID=A0A2K5ATI7_9ARCH|nr:protein of unknown function [Candidatus Nitrosocaldus cavascurensis]
MGPSGIAIDTIPLTMAIIKKARRESNRYILSSKPMSKV